MTTATTSRGSTFGTVIVLAIVASVAFALTRGRGEGTPAREDKEDNIVLEVHFKPYPRATNSLHVIATAEGVPIFNEFPETSPWVKSLWVPKGSKVVLSAWQTSKGTLQCIIRHKGKVIEDYTEAAGGGMESRVTCIYRSS